jgi:hypothetical protein
MNILSHLHTILTTLTTLTTQWFVDSCGIHPMPCQWFGDGDLTINWQVLGDGILNWHRKNYPHFYWLISSHTYPIIYIFIPMFYWLYMKHIPMYWQAYLSRWVSTSYVPMFDRKRVKWTRCGRAAACAILKGGGRMGIKHFTGLF